jgi:hypothetical protein
VCPFVAAVVGAGIVVGGGVVRGQRRDGPEGAAVRFTDVSREAGVDFRHINGASPDGAPQAARES